jgi:hypothetical protein
MHSTVLVVVQSLGVEKDVPDVRKITVAAEVICVPDDAVSDFAVQHPCIPANKTKHNIHVILERIFVPSV